MVLSPDDETRYPLLSSKSKASLQLRFALIYIYNYELNHVINLIDIMNSCNDTTLGYKLCSISYIIFQRVKEKCLDRCIKETEIERPFDESHMKILLDNHKAFMSLEKAQRLKHPLDILNSECLFIQFHNAMKEFEIKYLRCPLTNKGILFGVIFNKEEGLDWGGLYRETLERCVGDLFSNIIDLFIPIPNNRSSDNNDKYIPNPKHCSLQAMSMYKTVGYLLGISLRTGNFLPFFFPSIIWKRLVGKKCDKNDLKEIDKSFVNTLESIENYKIEDENSKSQEELDEEFEMVFGDLFYTILNSNNNEEELIPNGSSIKVKYNDRINYVKMALEKRLSEFDDSCESMENGLSELIPIRALKLFTWNELEVLVCGSHKLDINLLKSKTVYQGYTPDHPTIISFWKVLDSFSDEDKSQFLRFTWGRSRLPPIKQWTRPLKIVLKDINLNYLPVAHTCFFQLDLPPYPDEDMLKYKLLVAINFGLGEFIIR